MPRSEGSRFAAFVLGIVFTVVAIFACGYLYLRYGHPPVAAADPAFPYEAQIVHIPLGARIAREQQQPPFPASEDAFEKGAQTYMEDCAFCHGTPGAESPYGADMYPSAPQLWKKHKTGKVVGVSDDPAGESFWKIKNGIRLTGMPAYQKSLSDAEMWDVALLLKNADQPLPDPVTKILAGDAK